MERDEPEGDLSREEGDGGWERGSLMAMAAQISYLPSQL